MNIKLGFILSFIAGLSTLIGSVFIFFNNKKKDNIILAALAFASGVMSFVSFFDLIPEAFNILNKSYNNIFSLINILLFIIIGIVLSILIDKLLPDKTYNKKDKLYHVGLFSMIAIIIHNIPEGIATFLTTTSNLNLGLKLTIAIALHNIPEGISISLPIYYSLNNKKKAFLYTFISSISEPFGAFLCFIFIGPYVNILFLGFLFSLISGIMLYISIYELLKESLSYNKKYLTIIFYLIGSIFTILNSIFF
ncbi:MAG TPA: ZIP family metal transporter [Bacilli bacterium]|nr:ZIP family metal transporter [Bacilli bacterium]